MQRHYQKTSGVLVAGWREGQVEGARRAGGPVTLS